MLEIAENVVVVLAKIQRFLGCNRHAPNSLEHLRFTPFFSRIFYMKDLLRVTV